MSSKSVLRAVCGSMVETFDDVDYFPSYELIASPSARGFFYEPNLRSINRNGVALVMSQFLAAHASGAELNEQHMVTRNGNPREEWRKGGKVRSRADRVRRNRDVVCEDELLEAFAK